MKIYILTPNANALFNPALKEKLNKAGEIVEVNLQPMTEMSGVGQH